MTPRRMTPDRIVLRVRAEGGTDTRTRVALRACRELAERDDVEALELASLAGRVAARAGLSHDEAIELGCYAVRWRELCQGRQ